MIIRLETIGSFKSITGEISKKSEEFPLFLFSLSVLLNSKIQRRVQNTGLGSNDRPLKRYSTNYARKRRETGRQARFRDLTFSGNMFQSLTVESIGKNRVKMFFGSASERQKAFFNDEKTPFFSLSPSERVFLKKELNEFVKL